jgi:hypothetical protein
MKISEIVIKLMSDKDSLDYCVTVSKMGRKSVICESDIRIKKVLTTEEQNFLEENTEEISDIFRKM